MRAKIQGFIVNSIYLSIIISAFFNFRYQLNLVKTWDRLYLLSIVILLSLDAAYIIICSKARNWKVNVLFIVIAVFLLYEFIVSIFNGLLYIEAFIRDALPWPMTFYVLYDYIKKNETPKSFEALTILALVGGCILSVPNISRHLYDYGRSGGVVFPVYYNIGFLGIALKVCRKRISYFLAIIVMALLFVSTKRVGLLAAAIGLFVFFVLQVRIQGTRKIRWKKYLQYTLFAVLFCAIIVFVTNRYGINTLKRLSLVVDDEGSGRVFIWKTVITYFYSSSLLGKLFGHGFHSVRYSVYIWNRAKSLAHNSYLEMLYDFGMIGLVFLVVIVGLIGIRTVQMIKQKSPNSPIMGYSFICLLFFSMFSYFFEQSAIILPFVVVWSICLGDEKRMREN